MIITTIRNEKIDLGSKPVYSLTRKYSKGPYNKFNTREQHIRITEGCPNKCVYCAESWENGTEPIYHRIPEIVCNKVSILDMNLMYKRRCLEIIRNLSEAKVNNKVVRYELRCGVDWRYMTQEKADALKAARFQNIRLAWDYSYSDIYKIKDCIDMFLKAGYKNTDIMVFMICNWLVPFYECEEKLDTLGHWNIQVSDCWFDNQLPPNIKPIHWSKEEIEQFRRLSRRHGIKCRMNGIQTELVKQQDKYQKTIGEVI